MTRRVAKAVATGIIGFVASRPALTAFLRRQMYRFPGLTGRIRSAVSRSRGGNRAAPDLVTEETDLTEAARQVLRDLTHAFDHPRPS